jgi:PAS domain S-box-containing protein
MRTTAPDEPRASGSRLRILCVEDNPADAELCRLCLEEAGFPLSLDVVNTPEVFTERLRAGSYDLVLADYRLPGWTGLDVLNSLRQEQGDTPFILVTGALGEEVAVECLKQGVTDYVRKERLNRLPLAVARALEEKKLKEARSRAEEAVARLAAIVESSDDAIVGTDPEGRILTWNAGAERMLGYTAEEAGGRSIAFIIPAARRQHLTEMLARVRSGGSVRNYEARPVRQDGMVLEILLNISPVRDESRAIVGAAASARDITQRKRLERQLRLKNQELAQQNRRVEAANRMKSEFLANMSHELRSPLNSIIGFAELMYDGKLGPVAEENREFLDDILASARHLLRLINDVLDLSKVEAGRMEFRPEPVALETLVGEVRDVLRFQAVKKQLGVATEVSPELSEIVADAARLKQILYNYLSNALKFTPEGGRVTIRAKAEGEDAFRLEVEDTGIGIRPEDTVRLFQEFQQLGGDIARKSSGSGLGLALTKRIVEAQGGSVGVVSTPGQGSRFWAVLPRVAPSGAVATAASAPRILVVEGVRSQCAWLQLTLRRAGYAVEAAATGAEALARCRAQNFSGVAVDLLLPDTTGWEVLRSVRATAPNRDTPVILLSALGGEGGVSAFPVHDFLARPVEAGRLLAALQRAGVRGAETCKVLVVDDDPEALREAEGVLNQHGYVIVCRSSLAAGLAAAAEVKPAAVIVGLLMRDLEELGTLFRLRRPSNGRRSQLFVWAGRSLTREDRERLDSLSRKLALRSKRGPEALLGELAAALRQPAALRAAKPGNGGLARRAAASA